MLTAFCIMLLILGILTLSIISEIKVRFDAYGGENSVSFSLFNIKIIKIAAKLRVSSIGITLELMRKGEIISSVPVDYVIKAPEKLMPQTTRNPFCNLDLVELNIDGEYGDGNAFSTVLVTTAMQRAISFRLLNAIIKQKVRIGGKIEPNFRENAMNLHFSGIFFITLADIIYGLTLTNIRSEKNDT